MKELTDPEKVLIQTDTEIVQEIPKEYTLERSAPMQKGHFLFSCDLSNNFKVEKVEMKSEVVLDLRGNKQIVHRVNRMPGRIYLSALNIDNARRKFEGICVKLLVKHIEARRREK